MNPPTAAASPADVTAAAAAAAQAPRVTLVTHSTIDASDQRVWDSLQFYEGVATPPLLLRLLLPIPIPVPEHPPELGREATLNYMRGHYTRRVVRLEPPRFYEFEVVDQRLPGDRGVTLLRGAYTLRQIDSTHTDLSITTTYSSGLRPRWLLQPLEGVVARRLQRHLLAAIKRRALQP